MGFIAFCLRSSPQQVHAELGNVVLEGCGERGHGAQVYVAALARDPSRVHYVCTRAVGNLGELLTRYSESPPFQAARQSECYF